MDLALSWTKLKKSIYRFQQQRPVQFVCFDFPWAQNFPFKEPPQFHARGVSWNHCVVAMLMINGHCSLENHSQDFKRLTAKISKQMRGIKKLISLYDCITVFWLGRMPGGRIGRLKPDKMDAFNDCEVADDIVTDIINVNNENERSWTE